MLRWTDCKALDACVQPSSFSAGQFFRRSVADPVNRRLAARSAFPVGGRGAGKLRKGYGFRREAGAAFSRTRVRRGSGGGSRSGECGSGAAPSTLIPQKSLPAHGIPPLIDEDYHAGYPPDGH